MTVDTLNYMKRLEAAGVPRAQAEAHAEALHDVVAEQLVTGSDLGAAVDRLESKIEAESARLDAKFENRFTLLEGKIDSRFVAFEGKLTSEVNRLDGKIDLAMQRFEAALWRHTVTVILAVLTIGGLLIRFVR